MYELIWCFRGKAEKWMLCDSGFNSRQRQARDESRNIEFSEVRFCKTARNLWDWNTGNVKWGNCCKQTIEKPGYIVTSTRSIQQCGNNWGGDMKLNYESWCDACGTLWTAVRNCCCGEEVIIIKRSWQSSWQSSEDHGNHQKIMAIIRRSWQSSGHLVCDHHLFYLLLGRRRKIWYAHIFVFLRRRISYTINLHIFLRRSRIWYIIYINMY